MSGASFEDYKAKTLSKGYSTRSLSSEEDSKVFYETRKTRINKAREDVFYEKEPEVVVRETSHLYDASLIKKKITVPKDGVDRIHVVLIDNSGSNRIIAQHMRNTSGYFMSVLKTIDPTSQVAFMYVSDHCDGPYINQEVDFLSPDEEGDKALYSTLKHVSAASGGDIPEAFECTLWDACDINFGPAKHKHLYLVTDVVGHGMGAEGDDGCLNQRYWKDTKKKVYETYDTFEVIGCGNSPSMGRLQTQFLKEERVPFDLIDLSSVPEESHRRALTGNALLFLMSRKTGAQTIELFLSFLYEKWLEEALFGKETDIRAREMIKRFGKFVEASNFEPVLEKILS